MMACKGLVHPRKLSVVPSREQVVTHRQARQHRRCRAEECVGCPAVRSRAHFGAPAVPGWLAFRAVWCWVAVVRLAQLGCVERGVAHRQARKHLGCRAAECVGCPAVRSRAHFGAPAIPGWLAFRAVWCLVAVRRLAQ